MIRIQHMAFVAIVFLVLALPLGNNLAAFAIPDHNQNTRSYLEGREYQAFPKASISSISRRVFQDEFEQYVADSMPARDAIVLSNARMQRSAIEAANALFAFKVYPTFWGSDYYVSPSEGLIVERAFYQKKLDKGIQRTAGLLCDFVDNHRKANWYIALPERMAASNASPLSGLFTDMASNDAIVADLHKELDGRATIIDLGSVGIASTKDAYFKTDHHWQVQAATAAYAEVIKEIGRPAIEFGPFTTAFEGSFYGSSCRKGLIDDFHDDRVYDVSYTHGNLKIVVNGTERPLSFLDMGWVDDSDKYELSDKFANVYGEYYHGDYGLIEILNDEAPSGTLLIVGDSFTNNMERFFAESYASVYVLDPRHYDGTLETFFDEHDIDDVLILMGVNTFTLKALQDSLE